MADNYQRILVAIKNLRAAQGLVRVAASLANSPWSELHLTHVLTEESPPAKIAQHHLDLAVALALEMGVGAISHLERGPDVIEVIEDGISRWNCNSLMMAWTRELGQEAILMSRSSGLTKVPEVDSLVFLDRGIEHVERIVVPSSGGLHALLGIQMAHDLARAWKAELEIIRIARDSWRPPEDPHLRDYCKKIDQDTRLQLRLLDIDAKVHVVPAAEVVPPIVQRTGPRDLVVLGASNEWRQNNHLAGSIPDEIARQVSASVLMVRATSPRQFQLSNVFWDQTVRLNIKPTNKWEAITFLVDSLIEESQIPRSERDKVLEAAFARERKSSTGMGRHLAIPHAPIPKLEGIMGAFGICPDGVDFGLGDEELVHFIFLLLTPAENYRLYIPILAQISALMRSEHNQTALLNSQTPSEVTAMIRSESQV